jgi:hypothetical protein
MSINHNNRPSAQIPLAAISATSEHPLFLAIKKTKVLAAQFVQSGAISASGTNYLAMQLKKNNAAVGTAVDTQAGLAARVGLAMDLDADYIELEAGDYLSLQVTENGNFAEGAVGLCVLDLEVVGN